MIRTAQHASQTQIATCPSGTINIKLRRPGVSAYLSLLAFATCCLAVPYLSAQAFAQASVPTATHGIAVANMDPAVTPGDNFYLYTNGAWLRRTQIPPDRVSLSVFSSLSDRSRERTAAFVEEASKSNASAGTEARKIADLYNSFLNESAIEAKGLDPLKPHLAEIAAIHDRHQLSLALGKTLRADVDMLNNAIFNTPNLFGLWVAPGFRDSSRYMPYLLQGGLSMPSRDYYLGDNEHMQQIRAKYVTHVATMLGLAGFDEADARAGRVVALEHSIAEAHISLAEIEDITKANNLWTRADFAAKAPGLDWDAFFEGAGLTNQQDFMVWTPSALIGESALAASVPIDTWKDWLAFHFIDGYASVLPSALANEQFDFYGKVLNRS